MLPLTLECCPLQIILYNEYDKLSYSLLITFEINVNRDMFDYEKKFVLFFFENRICIRCLKVS